MATKCTFKWLQLLTYTLTRLPLNALLIQHLNHTLTRLPLNYPLRHEPCEHRLSRSFKCNRLRVATKCTFKWLQLLTYTLTRLPLNALLIQHLIQHLNHTLTWLPLNDPLRHEPCEHRLSRSFKCNRLRVTKGGDKVYV